MLRKALEMQHLTPYRGSERGTCRKDSYAEESEKNVMEGSGNGAFLLLGS